MKEILKAYFIPLIELEQNVNLLVYGGGISLFVPLIELEQNVNVHKPIRYISPLHSFNRTRIECKCMMKDSQDQGVLPLIELEQNVNAGTSYAKVTIANL